MVSYEPVFRSRKTVKFSSRYCDLMAYKTAIRSTTPTLRGSVVAVLRFAPRED